MLHKFTSSKTGTVSLPSFKLLLYCCISIGIFLLSSSGLYAQQGCTCDDEIYGPYICYAKLYCSNSTKVSDGRIACTPAADTDGCGVDVSLEATILLNSNYLFTTTLGDCFDSTKDKYVQWIKYYTPVGVNTIRLQGVGSSLTAWAVYHKLNNTEFVDENDDDTEGQCPTGDFTLELDQELELVGCSRDNQYEIITDDTAVAGEENLYYIAFIYGKISEGTVNFKTKDCSFINTEEECIVLNPDDINCAQDQVEVACQTQDAIDEKFDQFLLQFSYPESENVSTSLSFSRDNENFSSEIIYPNACGDTVYVSYSITDGCDTDFNCSASFTVTESNATPIITQDTGPATDTDLGCNPSTIPVPEFSASGGCGNTPVNVDSESSNEGCTYSITYLATASDSCQNEADSVSVTYTWTVDTTPPSIQCPSGSEVCGYNVLPAAFVDIEAFRNAGGSASDNCGIKSFRHIGDISDNNSCPETVTRTYQVEDNCGNISSCDQVFTIYNESFTNCETLYGYNAGSSICFLGDGFNRWGWYAPLEPGQTAVFELYTGNGNDCNPLDGPGTYVGTATATYSGSTVTVTYDLIEGKILTEYHVNLGCEPYPKLTNGKTTVAPGDYTIGGTFTNGVEDYTVTFNNVSGNVFIIIHGVACDIACVCHDESVFDDVSGSTYSGAINCTVSSSKVSVSPNPFTNTIKVSYSFNYATTLSIEVIDLKGIVIRSYSKIAYKQGALGSKDIDLSTVLGKTYFVRVRTAKEVIVKQIVSSKL
ncbi:Por secretion system C-terminal sorting domain-containing protein [Flavobacteriaceae bacterium MAR_2010_188]|nr:Por secretion system C-terminal sorting domain-containing protein [Flavobacteriaceae bacterium MAR_2010_188]